MNPFYFALFLLFSLISSSIVNSAQNQKSQNPYNEKAPFKRDLEDQLAQLITLEEQIPDKQNVHNLSATSSLKRELSRLRDSAILQQKNLENRLLKNKELLASLVIEGEEPSTETKEQDQTLIDQRKHLEQIGTKTRSSLKKARLIEAKAKALLSQINSLQAETFGEFLFQKSPHPFSKSSFESSLKEWSNRPSLKNPQSICFLAAFICLNLGIFLFGKRLYKLYLTQRGFEISSSLRFYGLSLSLIFSLLALSKFFYYTLGTEEGSPYLVGSILSISSLIIAPILFRLLGRIRFTPNKEFHEATPVVKPKRFLRVLVPLAQFTLICAVIAILFGYIIFGSYLIFNITLTATAMAAFLFLRMIINQVLNSTQWEEEHTSLIAFSRISSELLLGGFLFLISTHFWGFSLRHYRDLYERYKNGILIGNTTYHPQNILFAVLGFFLIFYLFRFIQWFFRERIFKHTQTSKGVVEAVGALTGYLGIAIATVASLSIIGLKSDDLAIILGALSLGIGFGLQNVINNFVSGIILLFERPVKIGDWIVLDNGLEGHIKRIRIRSTELETLQRASVVIPNADLISKSITNWTLHDPIGRIDIAIGVAYGSDTTKVKKVLTQIAREHTGVRKAPTPKVLFQSFGDSSLNLELRCFVKNVDQKLPIASDLRFAIDDAFRAHSIEIPFPQRDLHIIKSSDT